MPGPSGATARLALPYPIPDDTVDVPRDVQALADRLDLVSARNPGIALAGAPVLDVGMSGQIRAGRQLSVADFTALGLTAPRGLWNLSNLNDASGNGRNLSNKGAVPFGVGINGQASTAAVFAGSTGQALYIPDTGAADPFRITTGSWGCWFRTAKQATAQALVAKSAITAGQYGWHITTHTSVVYADVSLDGSTNVTVFGVSDIYDDRWHQVVVTFDGTSLRLYLDGTLEGVATGSGAIFGSNSPLNIGGRAADGSTVTTQPHYGRIDEAFVTADVLSDDQIRALYCAKIPHGYATTPTRVAVNVTRRRRGGTLAVADFPAQPLRLHNFSPGAQMADEGSNGVALTLGGGYLSGEVAGADGKGPQGGMSFFGSSLQATDAGLPAGLAARSYGCWFKTTGVTATMIGWGTLSSADTRLLMASGVLYAYSAGDPVSGPFIADGQWHFAVVSEDNAAGDGVRRKLYLDGRLVGGSTVMNSTTLAGANRFRIGAAPDGSAPFAGQIDGAFVTGYALTFEQVAALYAKGSQAFPPSPKNAGDHVEALTATDILATFDTLSTADAVDVGVSA